MAKSQKNKKSNSSSHSNSRSTSRSNSNSKNKRKRTKKQKKPRRNQQNHKRRVQKGGGEFADFQVIFKNFYTFTKILANSESKEKYDKLLDILKSTSELIKKYPNTYSESNVSNHLNKINLVVDTITTSIDKQNDVIRKLQENGITGGNGTTLKRRLYEQLIDRVIYIYFTEIRDLYNFYTELNNFSNLEYGNMNEQEIEAQIERVYEAKQKFETKFGTDSIIKNTSNPKMGEVDFYLLKDKKSK